MTAMEKMNKLLYACELCSGQDERSLDHHFNNCATCQEYTDMADRMNRHFRFLEQLSVKPYDSAKHALGTHVRTILAMPPNEAKNAVEGLLEACWELPGKARTRIIKLRTDLLMEIPRAQRLRLMGIMSEIASGWSPHRKMMEKEAFMTATQNYSLLKRTMLRKTFTEFIP